MKTYQTQAKKAVKAVRDLFKKAEKQGNLDMVWNLVTALRGPDSGDTDHKRNYTTPIRAAVLTYQMADWLGISDISCFNKENYPSKQPDMVRIEESAYDLAHFAKHAVWANDVIKNSQKVID